jgi:cytidylate kinase
MSSEKSHSKGIRIAVDGYSSTGKSTLARELAQALSYRYIDTGAMYRAVTYWALKQGLFKEGHLDEAKLIAELALISLDFSEAKANQAPHILLNGQDVEREIRGAEVAGKVSLVARVSAVRKYLVAQQKEIAAKGKVVMDGRDIASVVIPDAELKIFMTADPEIRAQRRYEELEGKGQSQPMKEVRENLAARDLLDTTRADSPLIQVEDALVLDNTKISREAQLAKALEWAKERGA